MALPELDLFILVNEAIIANSIFIFGCISVIIYYKCMTPKVEAENQENEEEKNTIEILFVLCVGVLKDHLFGHLENDFNNCIKYSVWDRNPKTVY